MNDVHPAPSLVTAPSSKKAFHIGLWIAQGLLAAAFLMAGGMKVSTPIEVLREQMPWVGGAMGGAVRFIGAVEIIGAVGLVLPAASRILPRATPWAAVGLGVVMLLAGITHVTRGELPMIVPNLVLGAMAAFIAWGRFQKAPIAARG
ncbi:MAG: DoxX family protein [Deltaproteobacteria bacterium]|nr:DoxX family protein [Deltaproteobacteria bacterium]